MADAPFSLIFHDTDVIVASWLPLASAANSCNHSRETALNIAEIVVAIQLPRTSDVHDVQLINFTFANKYCEQHWRVWKVYIFISYFPCFHWWRFKSYRLLLFFSCLIALSLHLFPFSFSFIFALSARPSYYITCSFSVNWLFISVFTHGTYSLSSKTKKK